MTKKTPRLEPVLKNLLKHIRNNGIFMSNQDKACSYVSYILSKDVQTEIYDYKPETFKIFQDFVYKYNNRPGFTAHICSNTLVHVISDIYEKMNKLYELYELYKRIRTQYFYGDKNSCSSVSFLVRQYNDFIEKYQYTNTHYKNVLDQFKNKIQESVDLYIYYACPRSEYNIEKIKLPILRKEAQPKAPDPKEQQHKVPEYEAPQEKNPSSPAEHQAPQAEPQLSRDQTELSRDQTELSREQPQISGEHPHISHALPLAPLEGSHLSQGTLASSAHAAEGQEVQIFPLRETAERGLNVDLSQVNLPYNRSLESPQTPSYPEPDTYLSVLPLSKEVGGASSSVMSTITSALRDVEPGPVLVVSGGMGVLFLLFKYSPVGSFFGGRRGRIRQIPSSFRGFPPDFANFQDYDGGFIGYGPMNINPLAE
ncbi:Plasmodium vivax Vir protein, putative [Plasmodium vivax]|uniref:Vir protein, putative n=1 Tax=Plasmodium vivax TaxID=5855 RepID=A0A1G4EAY5_PLAVI|nr:Plasmodium vivax Vir protein, putative [Plasmodium vivax]